MKDMGDVGVIKGMVGLNDWGVKARKVMVVI